MKNMTLKAMLFIASALLLTACPKKGGNSAAAVPPAAGVCTIGPNGLCVGQIAYTGSGRWSGYLQVQPAQLALYSQFLRENGLCHGHQCNQPTQWVGVSIVLNGQQGRVTITPYTYSGWSRERLRAQANVTSANNVNSFNMVVIDNRQYFGGTAPGVVSPGYVQPGIVAPNNQIQLGNVFVDAYGTRITTQLYYRGIPLAVGQLTGQRYS